MRPSAVQRELTFKRAATRGSLGQQPRVDQYGTAGTVEEVKHLVGEYGLWPQIRSTP